jgi:hypothetical protein
MYVEIFSKSDSVSCNTSDNVLQELTVILKNIGQFDVKYILTSPIKTITAVLKISTYIITSWETKNCLILLIYLMSKILKKYVQYFVYFDNLILAVTMATW